MNRFQILRGSEKIKILFATFFFAGYFPLFPGTVGTLMTIPLYLALSLWLPTLFYVFFLILIIFLGIWSSNFAERYFDCKDPKPVIIDEAAGFLLTMLFIEPTLLHVLLGFILFRIMDIVKPPPARFLEKLEGGAGIVADDLVAGFYSNLLLQISFFLLTLMRI